MSFSKIAVILFSTFVLFSGCVPSSQEMVSLQESSLQTRQLQTKIFETSNGSDILSASVATLQDLGFNIDEINSELNLVVCSKTRDARETVQQVGYFILALFGGSQIINAADHTQLINATVVVLPLENQNRTQVRLTIQRIVKNGEGYISKAEDVTDAEIYNEFYDRLSKGIFLEAHNL